jgi:hypothetical protein
MSREPLRVNVVTHGLGLEHSQHKQIDYRNSSDRRWLTSHMMWAMSNNRMIQLIPVPNT